MYIQKLINKNPKVIKIKYNEVQQLLLNGKFKRDGFIYKLDCDEDVHRCWLCGSKKVTKHHSIPKKFNPLFNINIPLCRGCHDLVHDSLNSKKGLMALIQKRAHLLADRMAKQDIKYNNVLNHNKSLQSTLNKTRLSLDEAKEILTELRMENRLLKEFNCL